MSRQPDHILDRVGERIQQWREELPDLDTRAMAILGRMRMVTLELRPRIEAVFARFGIDTGEFDVLATLLRAGPPYRLRPTELFRSLLISSGGLTDRLGRLEKAGLITRRPAPDDARSLLVELTSKGRQVAERAFRKDMALEAEFLSVLSEAESQLLEGLLRRLALHVEDSPAGRADDAATGKSDPHDHALAAIRGPKALDVRPEKMRKRG